MPPPNVAAVQTLLAAQPGAAGASLSSPPGVLLYKVMGRMFGIVSVTGGYVILKCDPHLAEVMRAQYAGIGHKSHLDRRFWISVDLGGDVPATEIARLVAHSYAQVCAKLTRKQQAELAAQAASPAAE